MGMESESEGRPLDDDMLIRQASRYDVAAYEELVRRYQDLAFRTAYLITGEATAAEDATQEAFLRIYRSLPRFRLGSPFRPWLLRIVANEARRRRAHSDRQTRIELQVARQVPPSWGRSVEGEVMLSEERRRLHEAVQQLPPTDQLVISFRFVLDLSEAEIATAMDCPRGTVKSRLSRAMARLRSILTSTDLALNAGVNHE